ncbi:serine hydrolase [Telluribacter sp.]|jgi:CubicO group peptidase (beta-lactamase class C family)|uniref:serine hydrolase domain-containing protein n=1 Tax=Telluribacter sp. TaxID=1978767 RepID=UPI002E144429|nr:serine hydrolase [Telluribacter sp.]
MIRNFFYALVLGASLFACQPQPQQATTTGTSQQATQTYFPGKGEWKSRQPEEAGMDAALLQEAVAWAQTQETQQMPKDFSTQEQIFGKPLGPLPATRASTNGIIIKDGYIVAEWGDTKAVDPTYSAAKSFLSTLLGLTLDRGMIKNITDPVANYIKDGGYDSEQNRKITWEHHARQTSEWEGEVWGKKHDFVGKEAFSQGERKPRALQEPGTYYEYNDTRINRLALSLLRLWQKPLPEVLKDEIMDPIGASDTWRWVPYQNSVVEINGKPMPSVSGGTRWGGGLWINTRDEARFGYLFLRGGRWKDKQLISEKWVREATTRRGPVGPDYGYLWWLNTDGKAWPDAPTTSYAALGAGQNTIWIDPEHDIVIVWRWQNGDQNGLIKRVLAAVK